MGRCHRNKLTRQQMLAVIRNAQIARSCRRIFRGTELNLYTYESKCEGDDLILILCQLVDEKEDCHDHHDDGLHDGEDWDCDRDDAEDGFIDRPGRPRRNELTLEFEIRCGSHLLVVTADSKIELPCRGGRDAAYVIVRIRPCDLTGHCYDLNNCFDC